MIGEAEIEEVVACLRSGWIGTGPRAARFEDAFAAHLSADHAVGVSSGTAALILALVASGVGAGDEVVTTPMTFCATVNAILHAGATPVLADVDPETMLLTPEAAAGAVTGRTAAILPVHLAGHPADVPGFAELARSRDLRLVYDAAHAIETTWRGESVARAGDASCYSFYVTKNLATGEGGMVVTGREDWAATVRTLAHHGLSRDAWRRFGDDGYRHYSVVRPGFKFNLTDLSASIGLRQLERLEARWSRRDAIWRRYDEAFRDLPVRLPPEAPADCRHGRHLYTLRLRPEGLRIDRDGFLHAMHRENIGTGVHYVGLHLHPFYRDEFGYRPEDFPAATEISETTASIPLSAGLSDRDVDDVIAAVTRIFTHYAL